MIMFHISANARHAPASASTDVMAADSHAPQIHRRHFRTRGQTELLRRSQEQKKAWIPPTDVSTGL